MKVLLYQPLVLFLPKFYIQAIFVIIGDISTIMYLYYFKSIVYNPTSELVLSIRIDAINQVVISS